MVRLVSFIDRLASLSPNWNDWLMSLNWFNEWEQAHVTSSRRGGCSEITFIGDTNGTAMLERKNNLEAELYARTPELRMIID